MDIFQAIFLGLVQGITEWLPISSSGHLAIFQNFFGLAPPLFFDILLHFGTLTVIFLVFWKDIIKGVKDRDMILKILIASIPVGLVGLLFNDMIEGIFVNLEIVGLLLILNGLILYSTRYFEGKNKEITKKNSLFVGLFQALAILPGISRSGSTISAALFKGIERKKAASFSFMIAILPIIGATLFELNKVSGMASLNSYAFEYIIGTIVAVVVGYASLKILLKLLTEGKFKHFSYYCFILGAAILLISLF